MDQITTLLTTFGGKYPIIITIFTVIGVLRVINKPLFAFFHAFVAATPSTKDDEILASVEQSKVYKAICFVLDWTLSIKVGTQK